MILWYDLTSTQIVCCWLCCLYSFSSETLKQAWGNLHVPGQRNPQLNSHQESFQHLFKVQGRNKLSENMFSGHLFILIIESVTDNELLFLLLAQQPFFLYWVAFSNCNMLTQCCNILKIKAVLMQCKNNLFIILTPNNKLFFFNLEIVAVPCFAKSWYCYSTEGPYCSALGFGVFSFPLVHISSFLLPCAIVTSPLQGSMSHMSYLQHVAHTFVIS